MNVLLIKHPTIHFKHTAPPVSGIPLGLLYIAASLRNAGHDIQVYDAIVDAEEQRWGFAQPEGVMRMGATWDEIRKAVEKVKPDVVGISNQYSSQVSSAIKTAEVVKNAHKEIKVIVGGSHATVMPETFLYHNSPIDYAVMGEGEATIVELLDCFANPHALKSVKGVAYLDDGELFINQKREFVDNLDSLPFPAYDLVDMERYFYFNKNGKDGRESYRYPGSQRSVSMITSRGCPFRCIFCSIQLVMGQKFRTNSVDFVLKHIQLLREKYKLKHIHFEDDNISFDMMRFKNILEGLISHNMKMTWDTPNGVRADYLNEDILKKCKKSGCTYMRIGIESADEFVSSKIIRKQIDLRRIDEIARLCCKIGIDLEGFYIIGFPGEKITQMKKTVDFAISQQLRNGLYPYDLFTATPLLGTELYRISREKGYISKVISPENLAQATQGDGMITTEDFSPVDLKRLLKNFRIRRAFAGVLFFFKFVIVHPGYILARIRDRFFLLQQLGCLMRYEVFDFFAGIFIDRYKNCVIRRVGL